MTAGFAVVAVSGTRDFLHFQDRIWQVAVAANEAGIENTRLDSGAQWNGEHLYQGWDDMPPSRHNQPWWNNLFSWNTDSSYVVATLPIPGYVEVWNVTYDSWLPPGEPWAMWSKWLCRWPASCSARAVGSMGHTPFEGTRRIPGGRDGSPARLPPVHGASVARRRVRAGSAGPRRRLGRTATSSAPIRSLATTMWPSPSGSPSPWDSPAAVQP